jgi:hypothetical protein
MHQELEEHFPVVMTIGCTDLRGLGAFMQGITNFNPQLRHERAGSRFVDGADASSEEGLAWLSESAFDWFRGWVYSVFTSSMTQAFPGEQLDSGKSEAVFRSNRSIFEMLCELGERRVFAQQLIRESVGEVRPVPWLMGLYFVGLAPDNATGFVQGVFARLLNSREKLYEKVAWTEAALASDRRGRALGWALLIGGGAMLLVALLLLIKLRNIFL